MFPTFVIGLREGLEASLIVGIVAAFLRKQGRTDALRWVWSGVAAAAAICLGVGIALRLLSDDLPQRQQEGLETVVGGVAVVMVTYMVVWMRRHARDLKGALEGAAGNALANGSALALVAMAFLAVLREGLETAVFLLAAFNASDSKLDSSLGATVGLVVAIGLGAALYRGGVKVNLARFFRLTGLVLAVLAAGLVMSALHTAHEAGWLTVGQQQTLDVSWLVRPGTVQSSLLTGVLGLQPRPVLIELIGWLVYLIPVALFLGWPKAHAMPARMLRRGATGLGLTAVIAAAALVATAPRIRLALAAGTASTGAATGSASVAVDASGLIASERGGASATSAVRVLSTGAVTSSGHVSVSGKPLLSYSSTWTLDSARRASSAAARNVLPGFIFPAGTASGTVWLAEIGAAAPLHLVGTTTRAGRTVREYTATGNGSPGAVDGLPTATTQAQLQAVNGGHLPLGLNGASLRARIPLSYAPRETVIWWVDPATGVVLERQRQVTETAVVSSGSGPVVVAPVISLSLTDAPASVAAATATAVELTRSADRHRLLARNLPIGMGFCAAALLLASALSWLGARRRHSWFRPDAVLEGGPVHNAPSSALEFR